jgi:hypothetical protein
MKLSPYADGRSSQPQPLAWSARSGPVGTLGSLNPSEAPEQLHDLFNHECAISYCAVPSPGAKGRITLSHL